MLLKVFPLKGNLLLKDKKW